MTEYIDKQAFNDAIREAIRRYPNTFYNGLETARQIAHDMDAADVQPVRHGRWEEDCSGVAVCSVCGEYAFETSTHHLCGWFPNYCPNCGAQMDGGET